MSQSGASLAMQEVIQTMGVIVLWPGVTDNARQVLDFCKALAQFTARIRLSRDLNRFLLTGIIV